MNNHRFINELHCGIIALGSTVSCLHPMNIDITGLNGPFIPVNAYPKYMPFLKKLILASPLLY